MNFDKEGLVLFLTVTLEQAEKISQDLIDEDASTCAERKANDDQIVTEIYKFLETRLRELGPSRLDIYPRTNGTRERVIDGSDGLWIIALSLQDYSLQETLTESPISVIMAVKMTDGVARFEDFICAVIYDHGRGQYERVLVIEKSMARYADGRTFQACLEVDDPEIDEVIVDEEMREEIGVIYASFLTVSSEVTNHISGELNSAESLFTYSLYSAVGGTVIDEMGHEISQKIIGDTQWLRASVVAE